MGNRHYKFISIHKYSRNGFERDKVESYQESLFKELRNLLRGGIANFLVLELEGGKLNWFQKFHHATITLSQFKTYVIEITQPREVCLKYNQNQRSFNDITEAIEDMKKFEISPKMLMIDPTYIIDPKLKAKEPANSTLDLATNLANLLQDKNVMQLLQSQLTQPKPLMSEPFQNQNQQHRNQNQQQQQQNQHQNQNQQNQNQQNQNQNQHQNQQNQNQNLQNQQNQNQQHQSFNHNPPQNFGGNQFQSAPPFNYNQPREPQFEECPVFVPKKIIDYKHVHMPTLEEQLMEFRVFRVIDYRHQSTMQLREFVHDIDIDKIIEKRKSVALRKKILEYLKSAERPEDTVSNPKYPRNWEAVVPASRPALKNKRKKKLTAKIRRVIAEKARNSEAQWMIGYKESGELEEISSDEEMPPEEPKETPKKTLFPVPLSVLPEPVKPKTTTIPDFNPYNHGNVRSIRDFLYRPGRASRPQKILIILRGAPGSGKSHLSQLIKRKETEMGGDVRILSINRYFDADREDDELDSGYCSQMTETYIEQMVKLLKKPETTNFYNFVIVDAENCDLSFYMKFYNAGAAIGFTSFTIELHQNFEVCAHQNVNKKSMTEIRSEMAKLEKNRIPASHTLLIATDLYVDYDCLVNKRIQIEGKKDGEEPMEVETETEIPSISSSPKNVVKYDECPKLSGVPNFNWHGHKSIMDIRELLDEPARLSRPEKILIILRGAPGSGKTHLSSLIRNKEVAMGNAEGFAVVSIDDSDAQQLQFSKNKAEEKLNKIVTKLKEELRKATTNFIVVDVENSSITDYKQIHETGACVGWNCYTIELYLEKEVCMKNDEHNRSLKDIESVIDEIILNPVPSDHVLLNPSCLYVRPLKSALKTTFKDTKVSIEKEFSSRFRQPSFVHGKFVQKKEQTPGKLPEFNWHNRDTKDSKEILEEPGRLTRPDKIMIVLRGPSGSGKSYLASLIERKEVEMGNRAQFKQITMEKYFVTEELRELPDGRREMCKIYNFDKTKLDSYMSQLMRDLNEVTQRGEHKFIVVDGDFCELKYYNEVIAVAEANGFFHYTIEVFQDKEICLQYNEHERDEAEIMKQIEAMENGPTPAAHTLLDPEYLLDEYNYETPHEVEKMDVEEIGSDDEFCDEDENVKSSFGPLKKSAATSSKWDDDGDAPDVMIERLDGTKNKTFERLTMADYLQTDDEWTMRPSVSGKKRVRWADIEEKKNQERMREIGFIVGQTDWKKMTDTSDGKFALERTKYIEPRKK